MKLVQLPSPLPPSPRTPPSFSPSFSSSPDMDGMDGHLPSMKMTLPPFLGHICPSAGCPSSRQVSVVLSERVGTRYCARSAHSLLSGSPMAGQAELVHVCGWDTRGPRRPSSLPRVTQLREWQNQCSHCLALVPELSYTTHSSGFGALPCRFENCELECSPKQIHEALFLETNGSSSNTVVVTTYPLLCGG